MGKKRSNIEWIAIILIVILLIVYLIIEQGILTGKAHSEVENNTNIDWTLTKIISNVQFKSGYTDNFKEMQRARFEINETKYYIGLISLEKDSATISVTSPHRRTLIELGESRAFDFTHDNIEDANLTLNSINNNTAEFIIKSLDDNELGTSNIDRYSEENPNKELFWTSIGILFLILFGFVYLIYRRIRIMHQYKFKKSQSQKDLNIKTSEHKNL